MASIAVSEASTPASTLASVVVFISPASTSALVAGVLVSSVRVPASILALVVVFILTASIAGVQVSSVGISASTSALVAGVLASTLGVVGVPSSTLT